MRLDEEIYELEKLCPGPRLSTVEAWIKYLESKQTLSNNDIIQLPLHMLDEEYNEEDEVAKYSKMNRLENDIESLTKVRQVCMGSMLFVSFSFSFLFSLLFELSIFNEMNGHQLTIGRHLSCNHNNHNSNNHANVNIPCLNRFRNA